MDIDSFDIEEFRRGGAEAFKAFFQSTQYILIRWMIGHHPEIQECDREDLIADSYYLLFKCRQKIESFEQGRAYLIGILKWRLKTYFRAKHHYSQISENIPYDDSERLIERIKEVLGVGMKILTPHQFRVLKLTLDLSLTKFEIAKLLEASPQTILNHRNTAINTLRKYFGANKTPKQHIHFCAARTKMIEVAP